MNLKTSQIIQINQNYGSHRKSEVTDNHGRLFETKPEVAIEVGPILFDVMLAF